MLRLLALSLLLGVAGCQGDAQSPYVGTWVPAEADSLDTRTTFFADGTARIVRRETGGPQTFEARFEVTGDSVLTLSDAQGAERFHVRLDGDTLRLRAPAGGPEAVWVRL